MAIEFWTKLNKEYGYNFFSGIPFEKASRLYKCMDSNIMHYVPVANELIALRLATGAVLSGRKAGILIDQLRLNKLDFDLNLKLGIPVLIITSIINENMGLPKGLYNKKELDTVMAYINKYGKSAALIL